MSVAVESHVNDLLWIQAFDIDYSLKTWMDVVHY